MNKITSNKNIIIVIGILLLLCLLYFFVFANNKSSNELVSTKNISMNTGETKSFDIDVKYEGFVNFTIDDTNIINWNISKELYFDESEDEIEESDEDKSECILEDDMTASCYFLPGKYSIGIKGIKSGNTKIKVEVDDMTDNNDKKIEYSKNIEVSIK